MNWKCLNLLSSIFFYSIVLIPILEWIVKYCGKFLHKSLSFYNWLVHDLAHSLTKNRLVLISMYYELNCPPSLHIAYTISALKKYRTWFFFFWSYMTIIYSNSNTVINGWYIKLLLRNPTMHPCRIKTSRLMWMMLLCVHDDLKINQCNDSMSRAHSFLHLTSLLFLFINIILIKNHHYY